MHAPSPVGLRPYQMARLGIGYVPEDRRIFPTLTVRENLLMGIKSGKKPNKDKGLTIEKIYGTNQLSIVNC